jgi:hypothetical protein
VPDAAPRRHVVDPAPRERTASRDPPCGEGGPLHGAVNLNRFLRIVRARGIETALTAEPPRQHHAVQADRADERRTSRRAGDPRRAPQCSAHESTRARTSRSFNSATRSCVLAPLIAERATRTMSASRTARDRSSTQAARRTRLARFRATAPPTRRPATNATFPEPGATKATTRPAWNGRPSDRTRPTSGARVAAARSGRELRAALGAAAREHGATRPRPHAEAEAVRLLASTVVGLERSLGHLGLAEGSVGARTGRTAGRGGVYGRGSTQDKAAVRRKTVKRPRHAPRVENPGAIFRRAFPPPARGTFPTRHRA